VKTSLNRPSDAVLAARIARHYYLDGWSKTDIADALGISRFRVARLLEAARACGMVRIEIGLPAGGLNVSLSAELCSAYGLKHAFVFDYPDANEPMLRNRLGDAAAQVLMDVVEPTDVLGMAWSRSLGRLAAAVTRFPPCPVVQLTGAVPPPDGDDLLHLVRSVARVGGGTAHVYYAPMLLPDAKAAETIRRQPDVAAARALFASVTIAVLSIGAWGPGQSTLYDAITARERDTLTKRGVHVEIAGTFYDRSARPVTTPLDDRLIVAPAAALERIPTVLAVVYGTAKADAAAATLRSGLVNGLVTHTSLAKALL